MLTTTPIFAAMLALSAAVFWGSGDFTGGLASRRFDTFHSVFIAYSVGLVGLIGMALVSADVFPAPPDLVWGALAGIFGMIGLGFLYQGFATGRMGIVAPVSAVLATMIPVIFAVFTEGLPKSIQFAGILTALVGIWLLSRPEHTDGTSAGFGVALLAGLGFGGFFTALDRVSETSVFWPLVAGRVAACIVMVVFAVVSNRPLFLPHSPIYLLTLAGILDVTGNLFFLLAIQNGRLDVAAVLASLYPAVTAILARGVIKEYLTRMQFIGLLFALLSIVLMII
jgi:drug/metabolite transporter (DMT)-like permease